MTQDDTDEPVFICDGCLEVVACYTGRYVVIGDITGQKREFCHGCYEPFGEFDTEAF